MRDQRAKILKVAKILFSPDNQQPVEGHHPACMQDQREARGQIQDSHWSCGPGQFHREELKQGGESKAVWVDVNSTRESKSQTLRGKP